MTQRVQIPAYTDRWMMGDRYGEVVKVISNRVKRTADSLGVEQIVAVKLDKSGKTLRFILNDCTPV